MSSELEAIQEDEGGADMAPLETDVSDYVAGRLDPAAAWIMELRALSDAKLAAAIRTAQHIHYRVEKRLVLTRPHGSEAHRPSW